MNIEIESGDPRLAWELMNSSSLEPGQKHIISKGAELTYQHIYQKRGLDFPAIISLTLDIGEGVAIGVIVAWLYDKIKGKASKLTIDRTEVHIDAGEIKKVITEKIEKK